jgi:hypothetical protein
MSNYKGFVVTSAMIASATDVLIGKRSPETASVLELLREIQGPTPASDT